MTVLIIHQCRIVTRCIVLQVRQKDIPARHADSIRAKERSKEISIISWRLIQLAQDQRDGLDNIEDIARAAEEIRQVAEELRKSAENMRQTSEDLRSSAEDKRDISETRRSALEENMVISEEGRKGSEEDRISSEDIRKAAEDLRIVAEDERKTSEILRADRITNMDNAIQQLKAMVEDLSKRLTALETEVLKH